jgi:hypothetical protein
MLCKTNCDHNQSIGFNSDIVGLKAPLRNVLISVVTDEEQIKSALPKWVKDFGNYFAPRIESDYYVASLRECRKFIVTTRREAQIDGPCFLPA